MKILQRITLWSVLLATIFTAVLIYVCPTDYFVPSGGGGSNKTFSRGCSLIGATEEENGCLGSHLIIAEQVKGILTTDFLVFLVFIILVSRPFFLARKILSTHNSRLLVFLKQTSNYYRTWIKLKTVSKQRQFYISLGVL